MEISQWMSVRELIRSATMEVFNAIGMEQRARSTQNVRISSSQPPLPRSNVVAAKSMAMVAKLKSRLLAVVLKPVSALSSWQLKL